MFYNYGSLNIDYVYSLDHFVKSGETINANALAVYPGGKGLNQSVALARAGASVCHLGVVSRDALFLVDTLNESGVDTSLLDVTAKTNGHAIIQVDSNGKNCIIVYAGTNVMQTDEYIEQVTQKILPGDVVLFQNECGNIANMMKKVKKIGAKVVLNPSPMNDACLKLPLDLVDIFMLNEIEAEIITNEKEYKEMLTAFKKQYPNADIVLTLGSNGMMFSGCETFKLPIADVGKVVDTTAAGDTFTGYFLAMLAAGHSAKKSAQVATIASGIAVTRKGASVSIPYLDETMKYFNEQ